MTFTFDISVTALLSGAIGGIISQWLAKKVNKNSHQIALREEKFDDFTNSLNHLRDMLDMVVQSCRLQVLNYDEYNFIVKHNAMELFNRIFDSASKCSTLVSNYGRLYDVEEFDYTEIISIHRLALDIAMKMSYCSKNLNHINNEIEEIRKKSNELDEKWKISRLKLIGMYRNAYEKRQKDLK